MILQSYQSIYNSYGSAIMVLWNNVCIINSKTVVLDIPAMAQLVKIHRSVIGS